MAHVTLIYPYYENRLMLCRQIENWNSYSPEVREKLSFVLVDDGSQRSPAADTVRALARVPITLYRINENIAWNQHGARNLGAMLASDVWLFLSDMDIVLSPEMAGKLVQAKLARWRYYTFPRVYADGVTAPKIHPNTVLVHRSVYLESGGYDEDYCGTYGGDAPFRDRLGTFARHSRIEDVVLVGYEIGDIPDAATTDWSRDGYFAEEYARRFAEKQRLGNLAPRNPLRFTWQKIQ
jgi:hypothetical protein